MNFKKYILGLLVTLFFSVPSFAEKTDFFGKGEVVVSTAGNWASTFPKLAGKLDSWKSLELIFEQSDDFVRILSKNGDEVAKVVKNGSDEVFEIADDFFRATPSNPATPITGMTVKANTGETIIGGGFFKNADGSIGFVEDVSSYGSTMVQNTIKARGDLRSTISGITKSQDAHHYLPVQLLKENSYIKQAVEGGFKFNTKAANGDAIDKFVKATGFGKHGPHPKYTAQITEVLNKLDAQGIQLSDIQAKKLAENLVNGNSKYSGLRNIVNSSSQKLNDLDLQLKNTSVFDLLGN